VSFVDDAGPGALAAPARDIRGVLVLGVTVRASSSRFRIE
jgi:DNA-binding IclR family transcriptional regulator